MKKIFVSVGEFVANGGELKEDRLIFYDTYSGHQVAGTFGNIKYNIERNDNFYYVQIDCTPHYV